MTTTMMMIMVYLTLFVSLLYWALPVLWYLLFLLGGSDCFIFVAFLLAWLLAWTDYCLTCYHNQESYIATKSVSIMMMTLPALYRCIPWYRFLSFLFFLASCFLFCRLRDLQGTCVWSEIFWYLFLLLNSPKLTVYLPRCLLAVPLVTLCHGSFQGSSACGCQPMAWDPCWPAIDSGGRSPRRSGLGRASSGLACGTVV